MTVRQSGPVVLKMNIAVKSVAVLTVSKFYLYECYFIFIMQELIVVQSNQIGATT